MPEGKIIYVPLEHIDGRYTVHMDRDIEHYFKQHNMDYVKVCPGESVSPPPPAGMFLNAPFTSKFKALQLAQIARMYETGDITSNDRFFFSDIWFPGIESIAYMNYFSKVTPKITGIIHAGSFTDTDFVRDMERWAKNFEDIIFDIADTVFCASEFIKQDILKKRIVDERKLVVSGLPVDFSGLDNHKGLEKEDIIIFNGRICDEKQPWLFKELEREVRKRVGYRLPKLEFIRTQDKNLSKDDYYNLLGRSKAVVSYALQENFGFGIAEAAYLGCTPVLPNRLVYPELYPASNLFKQFDQSVDLVVNALLPTAEHKSLVIGDPIKTLNTWFNPQGN